MRKSIKTYLITDPFLYPKRASDFCAFYQDILEHHTIYFAAYRDKTAEFNPELIESFLSLNDRFGVVSLLNSNIDLALKLGFSGIHCNAEQLNEIQSLKQKFSYVFFSAHNLEEIKKADLQGANGITISPIFETPNKGKPLGIDFLKKIPPCKADIFALGGIISQAQVKSLKQTRIRNFASIRYFLNHKSQSAHL